MRQHKSAATVLATSREPLRVAGEIVRIVAPMATAESVTLFLDRARALDEDFDGDEATIADALRTFGRHSAGNRDCCRSDQDRCSRRSCSNVWMIAFGCSVAGYSYVPRPAIKNPTCSGTVVLPAAFPGGQQLLFDRLSVFRGSFTFAAEQVGGCAPLKIEDVVDLLGALVERSMVTSAPVDGRTRFRLLETLREFAETRLGERGEIEASRRRHSAFYLQGVEAADRQFCGADFFAGQRWFDLDWTACVSPLTSRSRMVRRTTCADGSPACTRGVGCRCGTRCCTGRRRPSSRSPIRVLALMPSPSSSAEWVKSFDRAISFGEQARMKIDTQSDPHWHHVLAPWGLFLLLRGRRQDAIEVHREAIESLISQPTHPTRPPAGPSGNGASLERAR